ncbi:glycosyltransferase family 2 protein [Aquipuribacter nitratireducens]|uniref:Glycosyltransferase family 2 protein n=1 Tax=Aquipuribacter nitratireducens TaxID=650104 RepID=A0ABW0GQC3_9MICO
MPDVSDGVTGTTRGNGVVVAVLTYLRVPELLRVLPELRTQAADLARPARVLVVDNDPAAGARDAVEAAGLPGVHYVHEPEPGIAAARNRALDEAAQEALLVFVDDDEVPSPGWLAQLVATWETHPGAAAVVGPIDCRFDRPPGPWVAKGRFFDHRRLPTGSTVDVAATNNLLLDLRAVDRLGVRFDARFGESGGSDTLFTREIATRGGVMVWCAEATVTDRVPDARVRPAWVLRRVRRGGNTWSRTSVALAPPGPRRWRVRASLLVSGGARVALGAVRALVGTLLPWTAHQARGVRLAARGLGMVTGAVGVVDHEYRRARR